jgi:predicted dehydrogenase
MIRIAFLGSDSTHTEAFGRRINGADSVWKGKARVDAIHGIDRAQTEQKAADLGIPRVASTVAEALKDVDLAMVIGRFGESHFAPASEAIGAGIPTFVDKPFTVDLGEAKKLAELARARKVPLVSSSPLRFAREVDMLRKRMQTEKDWLSVVVTVPANCTDLGPDPRLQSVYFYGIHGIEVLLDLVGHAITNIDVHPTRSVITTHITMADGRTVVFQLVRDMAEAYAVDLHTRAGSDRMAIELDGSYYSGVLDFLLRDFPAGKDRVPLDNTLAAISILNAIDRADRRGPGR